METKNVTVEQLAKLFEGGYSSPSTKRVENEKVIREAMISNPEVV